ncbi:MULTISPECIES: M20 family metallopeptidase [Catenuloplanes]|uniref:Succinyl-diaminopimelate desuccinylase n=1 Tax=Catenuloplanes niger TaxID=587534 RepID=A0AAE4CWH6_9ACTN|nr:M20/M25/M40 family metallo-hydrolase [Catenuloplanes niger]MDR7325513.1 succinyl-diaminopimelate desuccinylase [Catenuloplanes niger]
MLDEAWLTAADELLRIPSTADRPAELARALDWMIDRVGPGITVERFESRGKPSALLYRGDVRPGRFRIILNGHLDVVPAPDALFTPRRAGDRLYARGAQDMKLSALVMADVFRELAPTLPYPLGLQLVLDEEVGGRDGTGHQIEAGVTTDFAVIGEMSRLDITVESKGLIDVTLTAAGRAAHGAYPWLGDNALLTVVDAVRALLSRYPVPAEEAWRTTINVARIDTPNTAFNQVPAAASAWLNLRFPPTDPDFTGRGVAEVTKHLADIAGPGVTVGVAHVDAPHLAERDHPDVTALRRAARAQGYAGAFLRRHGAGDGRFYFQAGMAAVAFGIGGEGQHGPDEHAELGTIAPYRDALRDFLRGVRS